MSDPDEGKTVVPQQLALLVIGSTGNGKSSLCNTIVGVRRRGLGQDTFPTGRSMSSTTTQMKYLDVHTDDSVLRVVDTPDVTNLDWDEQQKQREVQKWKAAIQFFRNVVLLAIRCDIRYTAEEYAVYKEFLRQWGDNSVKSRLVVAFTFGDRQDVDIVEELKTVCRELKNVLRDARGRYVVFSNEADTSAKDVAVHKLLQNLMFMENEAAQWKWVKDNVMPVVLGLAVIGPIAFGLYAIIRYESLPLGIPLLCLGGLAILLLVWYFLRNVVNGAINPITASQHRLSFCNLR